MSSNKKTLFIILAAVMGVLLAAACVVLILILTSKGGKKWEEDDFTLSHKIEAVAHLPSGNSVALFDDNFATPLELTQYASTIEMTFSLLEEKVGSIVIWNGFCLNEDLYAKNSRAGSVQITDAVSGDDLGVFQFTDCIGPSICQIQHYFKADPSGQRSVKLTFDNIIRGSSYVDFCLTELSFWSCSDPRTLIQYPVGDRACYGVHGPVETLRNDSGSYTFFRDGIQKMLRVTRKFNYKAKATRTFTIKYTDSWGAYYGYAYDERGRLHYIAEHPFGDSEVHETESYEFDNEDRMVSHKKNYTIFLDGPGGSTRWTYAYDAGGNCISEVIKDTSGEVRGGKHTYTINECDAYGNWTSRTDESGITSWREITYYDTPLLLKMQQQ